MNIFSLLLTPVSYRNMPIWSHLREADVTETTNKSSVFVAVTRVDLLA